MAKKSSLRTTTTAYCSLLTAYFLLLLCSALPLHALPASVVPAAPPVLMVQGVGMAPLSAIAEICGAQLSLCEGKWTASLGAHSFTCATGSTRAWQDGRKITLAQAPFDLDGNCYAPLGEMVSALGGTLAASVDSHGPALLLTLPGVAPFNVAERAIDSPAALANAAFDQLFLVKTDGSRVQQLSYACDNARDYSGLARLGSLSFSWDGSSLLYLVGKDIVLRRLDSPVERLLTAFYTKEGFLHVMPHLLRDGTLYFVQVPHEGLPVLCKMSVDGSGYRKIGEGICPLFSADRRMIAYTGFDKNGDPYAHVMNADGSKDRVLAAGAACALSPDGLLLYVMILTDTNERGNIEGIKVSDGTVIRPKQEMICNPFEIQFSPDGKYLIMPTPLALSRMDADGANLRDLLLNGQWGMVSTPQFIADGAKIVLLRNRHLCLMNADGSDVRTLAPTVAGDSFALSADGAAIVFLGRHEPIPQPDVKP